MLKDLPHNLKLVLAMAAIALLSGVSSATGQNETATAADLTLFSPSKGVWYSNNTDGCAFSAVRFGKSTDVLVPADYDGDRVIDLAVWLPDTGSWMIRRSSDGKTLIVNPAGRGSVAGDVPVPADYNGDGKAEIATFRATTGEWLIDGTDKPAATFGMQGDIPVPADYDGDGKTDLAVFRSNENRWMIRQSTNGLIRSVVFGLAGQDTLVPADYTGDGKADIAVYSRGKWQVLSSETGEIEPFVFGFDNDVAAPADYDGDGITDFATYRKGTWYVYESGQPRFRSLEFGNADDVPLYAAMTRKSVSP